MNPPLVDPATLLEGPPRGSAAPVVTLLLLAPLIGEVLSGATRLSFLFVLVPEVMVWGCGALIIREVVRHWRGGGTSLLLLGLALSVAEEFVIQQTSIAPLPWLGSIPAYGRVWGVNWCYFLYMLGYEAVWIVLVPILVAELAFPDRRHQTWLRPRGLVLSATVFGLGSFIAWFTWTQQARPSVFHVPVYEPPRLTLALGGLAIVVLVVAAYAARGAGRPTAARRAPRPWVLAVAAMVFGFPWSGLMILVFVPQRGLPLWIPMVVGGAWGIAAALLMTRWASSSDWHDGHRWALAFGALLVCMLAGFLGSSYWPRMDVIAKALLNVIAVVLMIALGRRMRSRVVA
jgi:hypothetical protein